MNASSRTIRLFVSSTFSDMKAERDILQAKVFPRLQQHCLANGLRFQAIDLRWGVPEEAGKDNRTMRICLRELRRCLDPGRPKPNFLILLGDRYGWLPLPEAIPADLFETLEKKIFPEEAGKLREWYWRDDNAVPPVYELQPRSKEVSEWHESVEKVLLTLLEKAGHALRSDPALTEKLREALDAVAIGVSATEQEIQAGALSVEDARHHVYAFFRNITGLPKDQLPGDYLDLEDGHPSPLAGDALENLKDRIEKKIGDNIRPYDVPWRGDGVSEEDLGGFASEVYACLKTVIDAQIGSLKKVPIEEQEEEAHRNFGEERRAGFIGRKEPLKAIADYLRDGPPQVLAVVGPAGSGKSAVIAEAVHRARLLANDDCFLLARFLGVTSASSGLIQTLQDVVGKIRKHYPLSNPDEPQPSSGGERSSSGDKKPDDREIPSDINALTNAFHEALERATPASPLWLFLDALDQLRDTQLAATLSWLPDKLPAGVRLVVASALPSPRDGDVESEPASHSPSEDPRARIERNLKRLAPGTQTIHLKPLTLEDGSLLLDQWLANVGRRLQPTQRIPILGAFAVEGNALWLRVAAEEAVRWDSRFEPESPPSTLPVLLETVLMRLSRNEEHGEILVKRSLGYLASARQGLAEDELVGILGIDPEVMKDVIARSPTEQEKKEDDRIKALPIAVWVRLHGDITFYLTERQNQGAALFGFYHRSFGEAVHGYCLDDEREVLSLHETMVRWFGGQEWYLPPPPVPGEVQRKPERSDPANARKASELPLHLRRVAELSETEDRWDMVVDVLCDLDCVETKARSGLIYELVGDYNAALTALPEFAEENNRCRIQDDVMFQHNKSLQSYAEAFFLWSRESARTKHLPKPSYPQLPRELAVTSGSFISDRGSSTRAVNLSHFSVFVSNHLARLAARPQDTVSIAFNQAEDGPVASEAGRHLADKTPPWLRHLARLTAPPVRPECLRTLEGHSARVSSIDVTSDGRRVVSASWDNTLRIWDIETGQCLRTLEGHSGRVNGVSVSPDGGRAISGSDDHTLRVWNLETGRCLRTLEGHRGSVTCVSLSPGRRYVVSGSSDKTLRVWDIETGRCLRILKGHTYGVMNVSISPDGRHAISGSLEEYENLLANGDHALHVWDIQSGKCLRALEGHSGQVNSVRISPDGRCMISGSNDMTLRVWDLETGCCMHTLTGHGSAVETVFMSPDGRRAVSGSHDNTLRVWDLDTGHCLHIIEGHSGLVTSIGVSPDGRYVVSGSGDKSLGVWDLETGQCLAFCPISGRAHSVVFSPSGGHILCGTIYGRMHVLVPVNFPSFGPAILTSIRRRVRCWFRLSDQHSARCQLCAKEFTPPPLIAAAIREHTAGLAPSASPCLELPDSAFNDPRLLTSCPHCGGLLKFNPFFVHSLT